MSVLTGPNADKHTAITSGFLGFLDYFDSISAPGPVIQYLPPAPGPVIIAGSNAFNKSKYFKLLSGIAWTPNKESSDVES